MEESAQERLHARALLLTTALLLAPAATFFLYYGLDTLNNPVFGIGFVPYHLAGRLLAEVNLESLTNYAETGGENLAPDTRGVMASSPAWSEIAR